jgi:hypothetical protein
MLLRGAKVDRVVDREFDRFERTKSRGEKDEIHLSVLVASVTNVPHNFGADESRSVSVPYAQPLLERRCVQ